MDDSKRRDSNASDKSEEGDSKRTNQFSFVERATQTMNNALKVNILIEVDIDSKLSRTDKISLALTLDVTVVARAATCRRSLRPEQTSVRPSTSGLSTTGPITNLLSVQS